MNQRRLNYPFANAIHHTILILVTFGVLSSAMAQGTINFSTRVTGTVVGHVYGAGDVTQLTANTAAETPAGVQVYAGALLDGSGNIDSDVVVGVRPNVLVTKTADASSVSAGSQIGFVVTIANNGDGTANSHAQRSPSSRRDLVHQRADQRFHAKR